MRKRSSMPSKPKREFPFTTPDTFGEWYSTKAPRSSAGNSSRKAAGNKARPFLSSLIRISDRNAPGPPPPHVPPVIHGPAPHIHGMYRDIMGKVGTQRRAWFSLVESKEVTHATYCALLD